MTQDRLILLNLKNYSQSVGDAGLELARTVDQVADETGANLVIAVPTPDIHRISSEVRLPIFAQHVDPIIPGASTGFILPEAVQKAGAVGTLINHAEHQLKVSTINATIKRVQELSMRTVVCANNPRTSLALAMLGPDAVAVEPPELIGGDISVSTAKPEIITDTVEAIREHSPGVQVLCGAGVKNGADVKKAVELGSDGVLLASGVVKHEDPRAVLLDLISGL